MYARSYTRWMDWCIAHGDQVLIKFIKLNKVPSWKLTQHLKMVVSNWNLLFQGSIFSCYVSFREGTNYLNLPWFGLSQEVLHHSRCEQKSSALLCLNPFASNLPIVRLAFLCDLVCFFKNQNSLWNFKNDPGTSHANVGGSNGLDSLWPLPFRRGSWQWQLLWLRHPPYDATSIAPEFPSERRCQWQGPVGGQQLGFGYTQLVTQRGWGIRGCRG